MILEILFTSSVLIVGISILRRLSRGKISMRLRYMLWLLVAVRLLLPVSVGSSPVSVMNLLPETVWESGREELSGGEYVSGRWEEASGGDMDKASVGSAGAGNEMSAATVLDTADANERDQISEDMTAISAAALSRRQGVKAMTGRKFVWADTGILLGMAAGFVWALGFLAVGGYMLVSQIRFVRRLRKDRQLFPENALSGEWRERLGRRAMRVYQVKGLPSPCLVGRCIYIGGQIPDGTQGLSHILAHEYCHRMQGDNFWAFLRCFLVAVYWFDPLVWAAAFAARQDSELACDEAAVQLLGETQRYAYGRTLLALLSDGCKGKECLRISPMLEQGERSVRERIMALTRQSRSKGGVFAAVLAAVFLICGCAFTGADQNREENAESVDAETIGAKTPQTEEAFVSQNPQVTDEEKKEESARIQKEYDEAKKQTDETEGQIKAAEEAARQAAVQAAEQAAFEEVLNYHGVMEGKDDNELTLNRELDLQAYYNYLYNTEQEAVENPLEEGWYLLFYNEREEISLYGLYTEAFGFRGIKMKMMVGGDVNTWDIKWCPSYFNLDIDNSNIRVLERESNGLARRFVWKILEEDTSETEIWRLYSGYQYDTGTIDIKELSQEEYLAWAGQHLSFAADQEAGQVTVTYDGDTVVGTLDISDYKEYEVEDVQINTGTIGFDLNDNAYGEGVYADYDGVVVHFAVGLKLKGSDEIWIDGLTPLAVQVVQDEDGNFRLQQPAIAGPYEIRNLHQERRLAKLPKKTGE